MTMDFGPGKLDSQVLLDYGVLDIARPQARSHPPQCIFSNGIAVLATSPSSSLRYRRRLPSKTFTVSCQATLQS